MSEPMNSNLSGTVASLHLHSREPGEPFQAVKQIEVVAQKGIVNNPRYFGRVSRSSGQPSNRQVTLIEREQIAEHAVALGMLTIPPGTVRSNIETEGIDLIALLGREVRVGTATLLFYEPRTPCSKMDAICTGLRKSMEEKRQGVLAQVLQSGVIKVGDPLTPA